MQRPTRQRALQLIRELTAFTTVELTIAEGPDWNSTSHVGQVLLATTTSACVKLDTGRIISLPVENDATIVTDIKVTSRSLLTKPINMSSRPVQHEDLTWICYSDGGARPNPGQTGAAAVCFERTIDPATGAATTHESVHAKFFPHATCNIGEASAFVAAARLAQRAVRDGHTNIALVVDSTLVFNGVLDKSRVIDRKLAGMIHEAKAILMPIIQYVTIIHMLRSHGNPADQYCTDTIFSGTGRGDEALFYEPTLLPPKASIQYKMPVRSIDPSVTEGSLPTNLNEFAKISRYPTRSRVPDTATDVWANIVKHYAVKAACASDDEFHDRMLAFICLPTWYLPTSASQTRVVRHMQAGTPFNIQPRATRRGGSDGKDRQDRLPAAVERLAADFKIRSANRLLQSVADGPELPFDEKVTKMKTKILAAEGADDAPIPFRHVPAFTGGELVSALRSSNRQAAKALDGWTKDLLLQAISADETIADDVAVLLHRLLCTSISPLLQQVLTLSRGVAIPKEGGGIRPICISSILLKTIGTMAAIRDGRQPSSLQYAVGVKDGARRIVHKVRQFTKTNPNGAVVRIDAANAYGTIARAALKRQARSGGDPTMEQFYRLTYGATSQVVMFGPDGEQQFIPLGQGVKQGDSTSSLLFCLAVDEPLAHMSNALAATDIDAEIYMYMDDLTICVRDASHADRAFAVASTALSKVGLKVNPDKSGVLTQCPGAYSVPRSDHHSSFVILGANIAESDMAHQQYVEAYMQRQARYFNLMKSVALHPQCMLTLLRLCGHPRLHYFCSVTPPEHALPLATVFDTNVRDLINKLVDPTGSMTIAPEIIHSVDGIGAPRYEHHAAELYSEYRAMSLENQKKPPRVELTTPTAVDSPYPAAQLDSQWMFYSKTAYMPPAAFIGALCIRLNIVPRHARHLLNSKCNCGAQLGINAAEAIDHVLLCDRATPVTHTTRHNAVRDEVVRTLRAWGLTTTKEPTVYSYPGGQHRRPDALVHTDPVKLATDFSFTSRLPAVDAIAEVQELKKTIHTAPVTQAGHQFISFVAHTRGTLGPQAEKFIRECSRALAPHQRYAFIRELKHRTSVAIATARADALAAAARRNLL
jgi:ribonuclease HI